MSRTKLELEKLIANNKGGKDRDIREVENNLCMYLSCLVVLLGSMSVGTMLGLSSPLIPDIQNDPSAHTPHMTVEAASWFGALITLGGMAGGIVAGFIMQEIGRKMTTVISSVPYIVGIIGSLVVKLLTKTIKSHPETLSRLPLRRFIAFAKQIWMFYAGRIITGFGVGISSLIVPVYIGEIATAKVRGMLGSGAQLFIVIGILIVYGLGTILHWRVLCGTVTIPPFLLLIFSTLIPETPRYLLMKNEPKQAKSSLQRLRGKYASVDEEFGRLERSLKEEKQAATWFDIIKTRSMRNPTILCFASMYFQQISGINCVMFYAKTLFFEAGFTSHFQLNLALLLIAGTQVVFTLVSCVIVDRTGRKILLIVGAVFMSFSLISLGIYFQLQTAHSSYVNEMESINFEMMNTSSVLTATNHGGLTLLALISVVVFIAAYSIGIGPIAWLLIGEIIPVRARGNSAGLATGFNLFMVFILTLQFSNMMETMTAQGTFWFFALNCALSNIFIVVYLPETKGRTLEEIEMIFE